MRIFKIHTKHLARLSLIVSLFVLFVPLISGFFVNKAFAASAAITVKNKKSITVDQVTLDTSNFGLTEGLPELVNNESVVGEYTAVDGQTGVYTKQLPVASKDINNWSCVKKSNLDADTPRINVKIYSKDKKNYIVTFFGYNVDTLERKTNGADGYQDYPFCNSNARPFKTIGNDFVIKNGEVLGILEDYGGAVTDGTEKAEDDAADKNAVAVQKEGCEAHTAAVGWLLCPVLKIVGGALNWVDTQLARLLEVDKDKFTSKEMYKSWSQFRNIGLTLLVAVMLVMVISTALGFSFLDAYTVKKAMPRMIAAVIFMLLSWYICALLIELSNAVGSGVLGLMTSPFGAKANSLASLFNPDNVGGAIGGFLQIGGIAIAVTAFATIQAAAGILLTWMGTGLLIMAIAFIVLIARQMFIIVLILFAPLAILAWIFPGNDKLWKLWWQSFSKLLLMYPIVMALIGAGRIFAAVVADTEGAGLDGGLLKPLLKMTAYILPYAFIPLTFKAAGGLFGNLVGMANDRSRGAFDRLKKARQKGYSTIGHNARGGNFFRSNSADKNALANRLNQKVSKGTFIGKAGLRPSRMKANMASAQSTASFDHAVEAMEKDASLRAVIANDDFMSAGKFRNGSAEDVRSYLASKGYKGDNLDQGVAAVMQAKKSVGEHAFGIAASIALPGTGTAFNGGAGEMLADIAETAHGDSVMGTRILAAARSNAEKARRYDLSGAGFGASAKTLVQMMNQGTSQQQIDQATEYLTDEALKVNGAGAIAGGRGTSVRNFVPAMTRRVERAQEQVDQAYKVGDEAKIKAAEREYKQALASTASILDVAGQVSPENAKLVADGVMSHATVNYQYEDKAYEEVEVPVMVAQADASGATVQVQATIPEQDVAGNPTGRMVGATRKVRRVKDDGVARVKKPTYVTIGQALDSYRDDPEFGQMRREYGAAQRDQLERQQRAMPGYTPQAGMQPPPF